MSIRFLKTAMDGELTTSRGSLSRIVIQGFSKMFLQFSSMIILSMEIKEPNQAMNILHDHLKTPIKDHLTLYKDYKDIIY